MTGNQAVTWTAALAVVCATLQAPPSVPPHDTFFYSNDGLRLEAYLYKPQGNGPFPVIVYNHGSAAAGEERREWPVPYIARLFLPVGYAVLIPERRGYGKSEGQTFSEEIGQDRGSKFVARQQAEASDVNAAIEDALKQPRSAIDVSRITLMGWSFGGIVSTLAASRSTRYANVVLQAPGSLNWNRSADLRTVLTAAARMIRVPIMCAVAENDATTESAKEICAAASAAGARTVLKIYPPFNSGHERPGNPPGHALFGPFGYELWQKDVLAFVGAPSSRG